MTKILFDEKLGCIGELKVFPVYLELQSRPRIINALLLTTGVNNDDKYPDERVALFAVLAQPIIESIELHAVQR